MYLHWQPCRKSKYPSFFLLTSDVIENSTNELFFNTSKNENSCGGRASELESDKFICT